MLCKESDDRVECILIRGHKLKVHFSVKIFNVFML